ncbi:MAG: hypothetical protein R6T92_14200 [Desulfosalsimonadaceae bacterium]
MDIQKWMEKIVYRLPEGLSARVFDAIKDIPVVRRAIEKEMNEMMGSIRDSIKPYAGKVPEFERMPERGMDQGAVLEMMEDIQKKESKTWEKGFVSGAVYHGDKDHISFLNRVYALHSQSNPLHADIWPSASKYEAEVVSMTADMLGAGRTRDEICGVVSSGGTESILLAMKTYRDQARKEKKIRKPEIVVPSTVHAAFDKAAQPSRGAP